MTPARKLRIFVFGLAAVVAVTSAFAGKPAKPKTAKKKTFDPKRWEKAITAFERQDRQSPPPPGAVLFVGSSSIRRWKLATSFPDLKTINRGFGGSHLSDSVHYADRIVLKYKPRVVVLYAGDNDVAAGKSPQRVAADFARFVKVVHAALPRTRIAFIAIKPSLRRWKLAGTMKQANRLIAEQCRKDDRLKYVDVFGPMLGKDGKPRPELFVKDGLHLTAAGYRLWASILRPYLAVKK